MNRIKGLKRHHSRVPPVSLRVDAKADTDRVDAQHGDTEYEMHYDMFAAHF